MQSTRTTLAFGSPFLLFHATLQITSLYAFMFCTPYSSILIQTRCPCCVTCIKPWTDYREAVSHTSLCLIQRSKASLYSSVSLQITRHLPVYRQLLEQILERGSPVSQRRKDRHWVNVLSWRSVSVLSWQRMTLNPGPFLIYSAPHRPGAGNDRDLYLQQPRGHFIIK